MTQAARRDDAHPARSPDPETARHEDDFLGRFAIVLEECIDCGFCGPLCPVDCIRHACTEGIGAGPGGYTRFKELQAWAMACRGPGD